MSKLFRAFPYGSIGYVWEHGLWSKKRGKGLSTSVPTIPNPRLAFNFAMTKVTIANIVCKTSEHLRKRLSSLLVNPNVTFEVLAALHGKRVKFLRRETGIEEIGFVEVNRANRAFSIDWDIFKNCGGAATAAVMGYNSPAERFLSKLQILEIL